VVLHRHRSEATAEERKHLVKTLVRDQAKEGVNTEIDDNVQEQSSQVNQESNSDGKPRDSQGKDGKKQVAGSKQGDSDEQGQDKQEQGEDKEGTEADEEPTQLTDPTVLGKIIWLCPANKAAIMFGSEEKDSEPNKAEKNHQEKLSKDELRQKISDDQYRTGLGMPIRTVGAEHSCEEEEE
jgi:hypothetical protein